MELRSFRLQTGDDMLDLQKTKTLPILLPLYSYFSAASSFVYSLHCFFLEIVSLIYKFPVSIAADSVNPNFEYRVKTIFLLGFKE